MELFVLLLKWSAAAAVALALLKVGFMRLNAGVAMTLAALAVAIAAAGALILPLLERIDDAMLLPISVAEPALALAAPSTTVDGEMARAIPAGKDTDRVWSPDGAPRMMGIYHANDSAWIPYRDMCAQRLDDPKHSLAGGEMWRHTNTGGFLGTRSQYTGVTVSPCWYTLAVQRPLVRCS